MTSIKVKFRESTLKEKEGRIYYQLIHKRVIKQLNTKFSIYADEWDKNSSQIVINDNSYRKQYLQLIKDKIRLEVIKLEKIVDTLIKDRKEFSVNDIIYIFEKQLSGETVKNFIQEIISRLLELNKERTAETYVSTLTSFMKFREGKDLLLNNISSDILMSYEAYLKCNNISMNTISFYMRVLRAVYNRAVEKELVEQYHPFKSVYTGIDKTLKRSLQLKTIKQIKELNLLAEPKLELARDIFLFSFYTRGMSFIDIAYLRKKDIQNNVIKYRRRKTGQQLQIKWEECMQEIVCKYNNNDSKYLLPIINDNEINERMQYKTALYATNYSLKKIAAKLNLPHPLTMYVARHSWASIAKSKNIPISIISEGMGHDSEATTEIYLASLDTSIIDKANNSIIELLL